jgi:glycosyltransferase involved in cell wall biosynthesis
MPRRRVLMLIPNLGYGGAETSFVRLHAALAAEHDVTVACFTPRWDSAHYAATHVPLADDAVALDAGAPTARALRWQHRWRQLRALKAERRIDVSISFLSGANALNAAARADDAVLVSVRGSRRHDPNASPRARVVYEQLFDRVAYRGADAIVTISPGLADEIAAAPGRPDPSRVHVLPPSCDAAALVAAASAPVEPAFEALAGTPLLVAAGRLSVEKGFQHLLPLFQRARVPGARLLLIGDGPLRAALLAQCAALGLRVAEGDAPPDGADVLLPGYRPQPHRYARLGRAFAVPSLTEGFGNVLVEALAADAPVLAADAPWGPRFVLGADGAPAPCTSSVKTPYGTLLPRIDADDRAWVPALREALSAPTKRSGAGPRRVADFDHARIMPQWLALVERLAGGRR